MIYFFIDEWYRALSHHDKVTAMNATQQTKNPIIFNSEEEGGCNATVGNVFIFIGFDKNKLSNGGHIIYTHVSLIPPCSEDYFHNHHCPDGKTFDDEYELEICEETCPYLKKVGDGDDVSDIFFFDERKLNEIAKLIKAQLAIDTTEQRPDHFANACEFIRRDWVFDGVVILDGTELH